MATRFGGVSPAHRYETKIRWVMVCLFLVILLLVGTLLTILGGGEEKEVAIVPQDGGPALVQSSPKIDVLVASTRIEDGTQLVPQLFVSKPWDPEALPDGVILFREKDMFMGKYAKGLLTANMPVLKESIADAPPITSLNIPPGFRAVSIVVDVRSGVEGFAKPGSRVDVLLTYTDPRDKSTKVTTISRFIKVLSVGGATISGDRAAVGAGTPVTLLTTERDAKGIELARNLGQLSLTLVGNEETPQNKTGSETIDIGSLLGQVGGEEKQEEVYKGYMYTRDPKTGKQVRMVLTPEGNWKKDENF
jgi:Flp pilus assembly protein CpaB